MARFVLVHGGWHGGWCFRRVAKELTDRGHDVATPDSPFDEIGPTVNLWRGPRRARTL
jgi:hypothetical protein